MVPVNGASTGPFYAATTELTWDLYDAFIFNLDTDSGRARRVRCDHRPRKPYVLVDQLGTPGTPPRSPKAAEQLVAWRGRRRAYPDPDRDRDPAPAQDEWDRGWATSPTAGSRRTRSTRPTTSARSRPMPTGSTTSGATWRVCGHRGRRLRGGRGFLYRSRRGCGPMPQAVHHRLEHRRSPGPKSVWWLASNDWVGVRVVCDP